MLNKKQKKTKQKNYNKRILKQNFNIALVHAHS
jgi:hypothetical protein